MARALSLDLRERVCAAIAQGASCHKAAARFGVSVSSAIRWQARLRQCGTVAAQAQGGDRRSSRIERYADVILGELAAKTDITLAELKGRLAELGIQAGIGTLWRFFKRHGITLKKRRRMLPNSTAPTSPPRGRPGCRSSQTSIPAN